MIKAMCPIQMIFSHGVGIVIIVDDGCILIRTGDIMDVKRILIIMPNIHPQPCGFDNHLNPLIDHKCQIIRVEIVLDKSIGNIRIDMILRCSSWKIP